MGGGGSALVKPAGHVKDIQCIFVFLFSSNGFWQGRVGGRGVLNERNGCGGEREEEVKKRLRRGGRGE